MNEIIKKWKSFLKEDTQGDCVQNTNCNCVDSAYAIKTGLRVSDVQNFLSKNGFEEILAKVTMASDTADGYCGPETRSAITAFQRARKLERCDGCVGEETGAELQKMGLTFSAPGNEFSKIEPSSSDSPGKIIRKQISDGVWYVGTDSPRPGRATVHVVGSGSNQAPSIVSQNLFSQFQNYVNSHGDLVVTMHGVSFLDKVRNFIKENNYLKTRIVGFSQGASPNGGAWEYAKRFGEPADELILLDPVLTKGTGKSIPNVSKIHLYCGSQHMSKFKKRWEELKTALKNNKTPGIINDRPSSSPGFSGHLEYFNKFYKNPNSIAYFDPTGLSYSNNDLDKTKQYVLPFNMTFKTFMSRRIDGFGQDRGNYKHHGVDYYVPNGTPVYAIADGVVSGTHYVGSDKYEKMTAWLLNKIKEKYSFDLELTRGDVRRINGRSSRQLYQKVTTTVDIEFKKAHRPLRDLFKNSPWRNLTSPSHGRWWAGISCMINHKESLGRNNPKRLTRSRYLHLQEMFVKPGERVKKGQLIGTVGRTGIFSSLDHLHLEIYSPQAVGRDWFRDSENVGQKTV